MGFEQWGVAVGTAIAATFLAIGAALQSVDSLSDHRAALPDPLELYFDPDAVSRADFKARLVILTGWHGRDSPNPPSPQQRAVRTAQGWFFVLVGSAVAAIFAWTIIFLHVSSFLIDISVFLLLGVYALFVGLAGYAAPKLLFKYQQTPQSEDHTFGTEETNDPHVEMVKKKIKDFNEVAATCRWPRWMVAPPSIGVITSSRQRVVVELNPGRAWRRGWPRHTLKKQLTEAGYHPTHSLAGGLAIRFCDPVELSAWLSNIDQEPVDNRGHT